MRDDCDRPDVRMLRLDPVDKDREESFRSGR